MEKFDIEAYLDGRLNPEELEEFDREMHQNPVFAKQVEELQKVTGLLRTQLLREQVSAALSDKPPTAEKGRWMWPAGLAILMVLAGYLFFWSNKRVVVPPAPAAPPDTDREMEVSPPTQVVPEITLPIPEERKTPQKQQPIASRSPDGLLPPDYQAPKVRGQNENNKAWKALLDKVWYAKFPPDNAEFKAPFSQAAQLLVERNFTAAFVLLEGLERKGPANDTLRFLKGYCLLEMGEGTDALQYFNQLEAKQPDWKAQLQWYRGLGLLLKGEAKKAAEQFREIAATPGHPFRPQSLKALKLLK